MPSKDTRAILLALRTWRTQSFAACAIALATLAAVLCTTVAARAAESRPATPEAMLSHLLADRHYPADWFTPRFRKALSPDKLAADVRGLIAKYGAVVGVETRGTGYLVRFDKAALPIEIAFDAMGRLESLRMRAAEPEFASLSAAEAAFRALPGKVSLLVTDRDGDKLAIAPDAALSVGSAFKLAVLAAIKDDVAAGHLAWDRNVTLKPANVALPTGILQDWPVGQKLRLDTVAALMISLSDNTAADTLLALAGRKAVEKLAPGNAPFLDSRSLVVLKAARNRDLRERYLAADAAGRRALLPEIAGRTLPEAAEISHAVTPRLGWFFSLRALCGLIERTADLPALHINPGLAERGAWRSVAFKGGGDAGVLNLTTLVTTSDDKRVCVAATWNDAQPLAKRRLFGPYAALLRLLRDRAGR